MAQPMRPDGRVSYELSPTRSAGVAPNPRGSRSPRDFASHLPSPCGGRAHRFASPVRRHGEVSEASPSLVTVVVPNGDGGLTSKSGLVPFGCGRADADA